MSTQTDACRVFLETIEIAKTQVAVDLLAAIGANQVALDEESLNQVLAVVNSTLTRVSDNGLAGLERAFRQ